MNVTIRVINLLGRFIKAASRKRMQQFRQACSNCRETQQEVLEGLLALNADSAFSRDFGLRPGIGVDGFRKNIPVAGYGVHSPYIDRLRKGDLRALLGSENELLMFALSSGTTAESKYIPITRRFLTDYRGGWQMWGVRAVDDHPGLEAGHIFQISSSPNRFQTEAGTPCGNISGLVSSMQNRLVRFLYTLPPELSRVEDPDSKYYTALRLAVGDPIITWITTANPGTLVQFGRMMEQHTERLIRDIHDGTLSSPFPLSDAEKQRLKPSWSRPRRKRAQQLEEVVRQSGTLLPRDCWPHLKLLSVWTGGAAGAYLPRLRELFGDIPIRDHGLHASEGRMTIPISDSTSAGLLDVTSHFFEFIPEEQMGSGAPDILQAHELERDRNYFILLTTASGLYRYDIHDVVRCVGFEGQAPMLEFLHKGSHISNVTGEKISESQVVEAVRRAARKSEVCLPQFTVTPVWGDPPCYQLLLEQADAACLPGIDQLVDAIDAELQELNCEYREKRETSRLGDMIWRPLEEGAWQRLARLRTQRAGSSVEQYKHPCLIPDLEFARAFAAGPEASAVTGG